MRRIVAIAGAVALLLAGCSSSGSARDAAPSQLTDNDGTGTYQGFGLTPPQPRPSFTLTDTTGKSFSFGTRTSGHPTLLFFGYTRCPDVCPTTLADAAVALRKVPAAVASDTDVVFVSTDVEHDTGPVIAKWLSYFSHGSRANFIGLRGTRAQVDAAQAAAHVTLAEDGGRTHSAALLLYGPDNYARVQFLQNTHEQDQIEHDLPLIAQ